MQRIAISDLRSLMYPNQEDGKDISDEELMKFQFISSNNLVQNSQGNMGQKDKYKIDDKVKFELEKQSQINNPLKTIMNIGQKIVGVTSNDSHYRRTSVIKSYRESIAHPNSNGLFVRPRARKMSAILTESNRIHVRKDKIESYKRNIKRFDIYFKPRKSTGRSQTVDYADLRIQLQSRFPIDQTIHKQKKEAFQQETKRFYNKQIKKRLTRGKSQPQYPILEAVTVHINEQIDTQIFKFIVNSGYMRKDFFFNMYMEDEKQKFNEHQMLYIRHPNLFKSDRQFESYINKKKEFFQEILEIYPHKKSKLEAIFKYLKYGEQEILEYENDIDERQIIAEKLGPWSELWEFKQKIIAESSPFGQFKSYQLRPFIVKGGDDLRQELVAMQLISKFDQIFKIHDTGLWLRPYQIIVKNSSSGFLEFCTDTYSINSLKKKDDQYSTILQFFINTFINDREVKKAQDNFVKSLAAYSIVCYLLQIKDRHNGNILLDAEGHIIHIDFGFMLGISPGGINLEAPTFQLTDVSFKELIYWVIYNFIEHSFRNILMSSIIRRRKTKEERAQITMNNSRYIFGILEKFQYFLLFQNLMIDGFKALSGHVEEICNMLEIMAENSDLPCFQKFDMVSFRDRFKENHTEQQVNLNFKYSILKCISALFNSSERSMYNKLQKIVLETLGPDFMILSNQNQTEYYHEKVVRPSRSRLINQNQKTQHQIYKYFFTKKRLKFIYYHHHYLQLIQYQNFFQFSTTYPKRDKKLGIYINNKTLCNLITSSLSSYSGQFFFYQFCGLFAYRVGLSYYISLPSKQGEALQTLRGDYFGALFGFQLKSVQKRGDC